jgi:hypothetical protein
MIATQHCYFADRGTQFEHIWFHKPYQQHSNAAVCFISRISKIAMLRCYHDVVSLRASCMVSLVLNFNLLYGFCSSPRLFFGDRIYKETKDEKEGGHEEVKQ